LRLPIGEVARPSKLSSALRVLIGDFHGVGDGDGRWGCVERK
jgi:hypothetical protein